MSDDKKNNPENSEPSRDRLPTVPALPTPEDVISNLAARNIPQEHVDELLWLLAESRRRGLTNFEAIGKFIKRDGTMISRALRGKYEASLAPLAADIRELRERSEQKLEMEDIFVPDLTIVKSITNFCDLVRDTHQIGIIWGKNQSGKSTASEYYANTHADTIRFKVPPGGGTNKTMSALAEACGVSSRKGDVEMWKKIKQRITRNTLLIPDEFHQAVHVGRKVQTITVDRIRELHDDKGCGVCCIATEHTIAAMEEPKLKEFLGQFDNRGALRMCLPGGPGEGDLEKLYAAYGLPNPKGESAKIAESVAHSNGISRLTDYFKIAWRLASKKGESLTWEHVLITHAAIKTWAAPKK